MKYTFHYTVEDEWLGSSEFDCDFRPHSIAYCCSTCGYIWARVVESLFKEEELVLQNCYWDFQAVPCPAHQPRGVPDWGRLPGSLLIRKQSKKFDLAKMWWAVALEHLPPQVLTREFELHFKEYEEKQNGKT